MTYENFVTDLDTGDAFTATVLDILVKVGVYVVFLTHSNNLIKRQQEIADRRLRANATERSLLSERTVRTLRSLVNSSRTYTNRFRSHTRRPVVNIPEYLAVPPPPELDMMEEDEDEFEMDVPQVEGARLPSDLHDAYSGSRVPSWSFSAIPTRRGITSSPTSDDWQPQPSGSPSNPALPRPWPNAVTAPSTSTQGSLSRQASIRRATRIRVDFNESSHRRRWSSARDWSAREPSAVSPHPDSAESVTEPRDGLVWNRPLNSASRRFFPLQRARRRDSWSSTWPTPDIREGLSPDTEEPSDPVPTTSWSEPAFIDPPSPDWTFAHRFESDSRAIFRVPRLRRGGVIPPESMISRHASPITVTSTENAAASSSATNVPTPVVVLTPPLESLPGETSTLVIPFSPPRPPLPPLAAGSEVTAYPTPGSTENENLT